MHMHAQAPHGQIDLQLIYMLYTVLTKTITLGSAAPKKSFT